MRMLGHEELTLRWGEIAPEIEKSLAHGLGDITSYDLFIEVLKGIAQCWVLEEEDYKENRMKLKAVAMTRILTYTKYKEFVIVTTTGKGWFKYGLPILIKFEEFAKEMGCKYASIYGRKGWARALPKEYKQPFTVLMKEL